MDISNNTKEDIKDKSNNNINNINNINSINNINNINDTNNVTPAALLEQLVYVDTFMPEIDDPAHLDERLAAELSAFADDSFIFPDEGKSKNSKNDENHDLHDFHNNYSLINKLDQFNNGFPQSSNNNNVSLNLGSGTKTFSTLGNSSFINGASSLLSPLSIFNNSSNHHNNSLTSQTSSQSNSINSQTASNTTDLLSHLPKVEVPPGAQSALIAAGLSQTQIDALAALIAQHQGVDSSNDQSNSSSAINSTSLDSNSPLAINSTQFNLNQNLNQNQNQNQNQILGSSHSFTPSITHSSIPTGSSTAPGLSTTPSPSSATSLNDIKKASVKIESTGDADLDKKKRNTAASARFRIKKKLKEQQLERSVRELNELTIKLEKKIQTLELENRLLRNLVVEKGEQRNKHELEQLKQRAKLTSSSPFDDFGCNSPSSNKSNNVNEGL